MIQNKTIVITGASSGIGAELMRQLGKDNQLILGARNTATMAENAAFYKLNENQYKIFHVDFEDENSVHAFAENAKQAFGKVDILINNAGISQRGKVEATLYSIDKKIMQIDYLSQILLTKQLLPEINKNKGNIVIISSLSGLFGFHERSAYCAAKHALHGFFETLQVENQVITTTIICPGRIQTNISKNAITGTGQTHGEMDPGQAEGIAVEVCVSKIINAVDKKRKLVVIAKKEKILLWLHRYCKPLFFIIAKKISAN